VQIRVGAALAELDQMIARAESPFDLVFIDADKPNNPNYVERSLKLTRSGSVIIVDNVIRRGAVLDESGTDDRVIGARRVIELMGAHPSLDATVLQTVGLKGYDGFAIALVR
jgi:predicted O-methyltransferase YrrM